MNSAKNGPRPLAEHAAANTEHQEYIPPGGPVQRLLALLSEAKRNGKGWIARCPAHDDRNPSLSIAEGNDGRALLKCHAGCAAQAIVAALGLTLRDLMPDLPARASAPKRTNTANGRTWPTPEAFAATLPGQLAGVWHYQHADGSPVMAVVRVDEADGKTYRPLHPVPGGWAVGDPPGKLPLYRLPGIPTSGRVWVCEGEKAADTAHTIGLVATTSAHGSNSAAKTDWSPLIGRDVVILPDRDAGGERYAADVTRILLGLTPPATVRVVRLTALWPDIPDGGDIADYIAFRDSVSSEDIAGGLNELADATPPLTIDAQNAIDAQHNAVSAYGKSEHLWGEPVLVRASDVKPQRLTWLWPGRFPLGKLGLLPGDPGLGKSLVTIDMAARVSTGHAWPDARTLPTAPGSVIIVSGEDDPDDTIVPRLMAADADLTRIVLLSTVRRSDGKLAPFTLDDMPALSQAVEKVGDVRLIVIDPISAFLGATDSHKNAEVRGLLAPLAELAQRTRAAVVGVTHLTKSYGGKALYRAMGSLAFIAAARAAWLVIADPKDPKRRLMLAVKSNLGPLTEGLAYRVHRSDLPDLDNPPCLGWESEPVTATADEILAVEEQPDDKGKARDLVGEWLRELLADGPKSSDDVKQAAKDAGHSWSTVRRAKDDIGVRVSRKGFGPDGKWIWTLPSGGQGEPSELDNLDERVMEHLDDGEIPW